MNPTKSYRIWMSQRNGSTLLCKGLESTGIAGKPGEFFNLSANTLCEEYQLEGYEALRAKLWSLGTTSNGVFGIKHSYMNYRYDAIIQEIANLRGYPQTDKIDVQELFSDIFPNCKHIFLTRRNKIRQAVSWWKAINDQVWHLEQGKTHQNDPAFYEEKYDFDALSHLFKEAVLRECSIQSYFTKYKIQPLTLVYEDFIQDFEGTIRLIVEYLEIEASAIDIAPFYYERTATEQSEQWVQQFREELQEGWEKRIW